MFSQASVILSRGGGEGGRAWQGSMRGACTTGGRAWQGACIAGDMRGRRDGHCSGRYASYWNALLLSM